MENLVEIGDKVRCKVSKLEGTVVMKTTYLYGCDRISLHHGFNRDGSPLEITVDEFQVDIIEKQVVKRDGFNREKLVNFGDKVNDKVSGFAGIAIGRAEFMYGCTRIGVGPKLGKDGKLIDTAWFDEPQLNVEVEKVLETGSRGTGGPAPSMPTQNSMPNRRY